MAAIGTNLSAKCPQQAWQQILRKFRMRPGRAVAGRHSKPDATGTTAGRMVAVLVKNGVPATNTEADAPTGLGDLCWDATNDDVYRCSAYTNGTTFTWTKIVD